jgi:uncharacterized protein YoxC
MKPLKIKQNDKLEIFSIKATKWIGSTSSLLVHTALFIASFLLYFYGINIEEILLVVTTIVSLEAIYLSIFIQMSVNRQARKLHAVARDVGEIQEDVEEIEKDVDEIQKDVDEIQEDVEEIQEDEEIEIPKNDDAIFRIEETLKILIEEISELKNSKTKNKKE